MPMVRLILFPCIEPIVLMLRSIRIFNEVAGVIGIGGKGIVEGNIEISVSTSAATIHVNKRLFSTLGVPVTLVAAIIDY